MPQQERRSPQRSTRQSPSNQSVAASGAADSNQALLSELPVAGVMGRVFNRILGQDETRSDTGQMAFGKAALHRYLDQTLKLADGEWFRGKKLDGVADALMEQLDADRDGQVSWAEFSVFAEQVRSTVAPGTDANSGQEEIRAAAGGSFGELDRSRDGSLDYDELKRGTSQRLPRDTDHKDLVAQLAARIALDAIDTNQRGRDVDDRSLSQDEWMRAATELSVAD